MKWGVEGVGVLGFWKKLEGERREGGSWHRVLMKLIDLVFMYHWA